MCSRVRQCFSFQILTSLIDYRRDEQQHGVYSLEVIQTGLTCLPFLATPIISCTAKSSQFAVGSPNPSSPSTISLMGTLSKTVVTFSSSSSGLKTFEKNGVVKC